jgi:cobalt-zinc-cadmium efflux system protein
MRNRLLVSLSIAAIITLLEVIGGILSNSLALLGDAGHVGTDALSLAIAAVAMTLATKPHTVTSTYGYHRVEVFTAMVNGTTLFLVAGYILYEGYSRILSPPRVEGSLLLVVAVIGLAANLVMMFLLRKGSMVNINIRGAFLHVLSDTLGSVGVITGGIVVITTRLFVIDAIIATLIGLLILRGGIGVVKDSIRILLEQAPKDIELVKLKEEIMKVDGVKSVHDLHVWSLTTGINIMSVHVGVDVHHRDHDVIDALSRILREKFSIAHTTIQIEHPDNDGDAVAVNINRSDT